MIALSWSAIQDAKCPFRFNALRIAKTYKEPQSEAAEIGALVAEILKEYRSACLQRNTMSDLEFLLNHQALKALPEGKAGRVVELLERFINTDLVNVPISPHLVRVESRLAFDSNPRPLPEKDGWFSSAVAFRMVADLAYIKDRTLWIVDDKTGMGETDPRQVTHYADLLQRLVDTGQAERL